MKEYKEFLESLDKYQCFFMEKLAVVAKDLSKGKWRIYESFKNLSEKLRNARTSSFIFEQKEYGVNDPWFGEIGIALTGKKDKKIGEYIFPDFITGVYVTYDNENYEEVSWERVQILTYNYEKEEYRVYAVPIDYTKPLKALKITIKGGLADDIIIPFTLQEYGEERHQREVEAAAKKEREKQAAERWAQLKRKARIKASVGQSLINVYFQPCSNEYAYSKIYLYNREDMLATYTVENGTFFHAIVGLAYGFYTIAVEQYDKEDVLLYREEGVKARIE